MIIYLERSGGFAAIELRSVIDSAQLADEERQTVESLVEEAHFFDLPAEIPILQAAAQWGERMAPKTHAAKK